MPVAVQLVPPLPPFEPAARILLAPRLTQLGKVLKERPMIAGVAVPGMPLGSPGMGGPKRGPINVYYLTDAAEPRLYEQR